MGRSRNIAATVSNKEGDSAWTNFKVVNGNILIPAIEAMAQENQVISDLSLESVSGQRVEITSHSENKALAYDPVYNRQYSGGAADFVARRIGFVNAAIITEATSSDVNIETSEMGKTALLLEPFKWEFGDIYGKVSSKLADKGYAVTGYSNAGVSWENVDQLDDYSISLINTHVKGTVDKDDKITSTEGLVISKYMDGKINLESWEQLKPQLSNPNGKNDMIILSACGSF